MRKFMKQLTGITLVVALVISSLAVAPEVSAAPKAKKIVMNKKKVSLEVGQKFKLKVKKIKPSKAKKKVTYKVNKKGKSVVKVTKKGVIKALAVGKATVKVTAKSNKKAKAKVKVTVKAASVVTPTTAPTAAPTDAATVAPPIPTVGFNDPTNSPATPTPTRTPKPTAAPTATPAPPAMKDPAAPYTLSFSNDTVTAQDGASFEITNQGVVISVTEQYGGVAFNVPGNLSGNNYDTVTVTYRTPQNVGTGFGCGLWRASGSSETDKETEDVIAWEGVFTEGNAGTYTATISGQDATNAYYINKALFFCNDSDALANGAARVTITSVVFSHSEYDGPLPTATPEPQRLEVFKRTGTITVDGEADDAWANIPLVPMDARITCDNAEASSATASLKLAWDANNLYGYAVVRDLYIDATAENDYQRDGFEFFLDEDNSKETNYDTNADAFQYRFTGLTKNSDGSKVPALSSIFAAGSDAARTAYEGIQIDYVYTDNGYAVEFKVPFVTTKKINDLIGFDAIVQDCKNGGRDAELYLSDATRTMLYYNLTDTFPEVKLVGTAPEATASPAPTATPKPPSADDIVLDFDNLSVPSWGTQATYTKNADGTVTINWPADASDWGDIRFGFNAPMDLSGYESVVIDTVENTTMNFSITDAAKKDEYNNRAAVGLTYGATFPLAVKLADILNSNVEGADYTNVYGVSIFKGQETDALSITVKSIRFIKAEDPEATKAPATEAPEPEDTEVPATDAPQSTEGPQETAGPTPAPGWNEEQTEYTLNLAECLAFENGTISKVNNQDGSYTYNIGANGEFGFRIPSSIYNKYKAASIVVRYRDANMGTMGYTVHYGTDTIGWISEEEAHWDAVNFTGSGELTLTPNYTGNAGRNYSNTRFFNAQVEGSVTIESITLTGLVETEMPIGLIITNDVPDKYRETANEAPADKRGTIVTVTYDTETYDQGNSVKMQKQANVYLPAGYDESKKYNVLYLMHGGGENMNTWLVENDYTGNKKMVDNLIANGEIEPLIIVTPTFYRPYGVPDHPDLTSQFQYELRKDLIPYIESHYSTYAEGDVSDENLIKTRMHRAFAGLSMGSMTTYRSALYPNYDVFAWFGPYSGCQGPGGDQDAEANKIVSVIENGIANGMPLGFLYCGNGVADMAHDEHVNIMNKAVAKTDKLIENVNYAFMDLPVLPRSYGGETGGHSMWSWHIHLYNCLRIFFTKE